MSQCTKSFAGKPRKQAEHLAFNGKIQSIASLAKTSADAAPGIAEDSKLQKNSVFQEALAAANQIYRDARIGRISYPRYHRVHVSPEGKIAVTYANNQGSRSEDEYYNSVPHDLTLWEINIDFEDGSAEAELHGGEERMGQICRHSGGKRFCHLPVSPEDWSREQSIAVYEEFIGHELIPAQEVADKRLQFDQWANLNLRAIA